jgi:basic membrane lipoprotein Med (substrate-binding protein (PBP1-ABC) superfamily)
LNPRGGNVFSIDGKKANRLTFEDIAMKYDIPIIVLFLSLLVAAVFVLASCDKKNDDTAETYKEWAPITERSQLRAPKDGTVTIAAITTQISIADGSVNEASWAGLRQAAQTWPNIELLLVEGVAVEDFPNQIAALAKENVHVIWGTDSALAYEIRIIAPEYPGIQFVVTDYYYTGEPWNPGYLWYLDDAYSSFLAGYIAAEMSTSGIIGFIKDPESDGVDREYYMSGAYYARDDIQILWEYVDISSEEEGKTKVGQTADGMYEHGADVILHAVGPSGQGVIDAAIRHDGYVIGSDVNQIGLAPEHMIASLDKSIESSVRNAVGLYLSDKYIDDAIVANPLAPEGRHIDLNEKLLPKTLTDEVSEISNRIKSKEWTFTELIRPYTQHNAEP